MECRNHWLAIAEMERLRLRYFELLVREHNVFAEKKLTAEELMAQIDEEMESCTGVML